MKLSAVFFSLLAICYLAQGQSALPFAPEVFSSKVSGAVCGFSPDGNTMYFAREDTIVKQLHLYQARKSSNGWTDIALLPFSGKHSDLGGRLSSNGIFYFTSDRPGGSANADDVWNIWMTTRDGDNWTAPTPLKELNDPGMECCPLPLRDGSLMFSADRDPAYSWWISVWDPLKGSESFVQSINLDRTWQWPSSLNRTSDILFINSMKRTDTHGMDDIYISFLKDNQWSTPHNLGPLVNTKAYEDGAILTPDEEWLIFCRHATSATPSQVLCVRWKPILKTLKD